MQEFLEALIKGRYRTNWVHRRHLAAEPARFQEPLRPLHPDLAEALASRGIHRLYTHQAAALDALQRGEHVMVVTPTASGKSLIYQVPALQASLQAPDARSLFLFPTKALTQDQLGSFDALSLDVRPVGPVRAEIYDGDTPAARRKRIKAELPSVLMTNPDMLHLGILAHHASWAELLRNLHYVVVDELHVYRGIFGAHLHHVLRRLRRLCRHYGSDPRFLVSSATVADPGGFGEMLTGLPLTVVDDSGAPRSGRNFLLMNPPGSPYTAVARLLTEAMDAGERTLVFTKARRITELLRRWVVQERPDLREQLAAYRAGYLPEERREIERRLFRGDLMGVVSTSALEVGVDVGGLDVCILVGYPGSMVQLWQRAGRVGRRHRESLVILVALPDALDQYFMKQPDQLFERGYEKVVADPSNAAIARAHLLCAASELPLSAETEEAELLPGTLERARRMASRGELVLDAEGRRYYSLRRRPQRDVNLRSTGGSYTIVHAASGRSVGLIDGVRVFHECHPGAIYLHGGNQYRVERLDRERRQVTVVPSSDDYYTQVQSEKETEVLEVFRDEVRGPFRAGLGRLRVTEEIKGYVRKRLFGQETLSSESLQMPPIVFETVGLWLDLPDAVREQVEARQGHFMGSIHAMEHAAISLFPLLAISDRGDLGGISYPLHPQIGRSAVFIYDGHPGGIGLAARGYEDLEVLLERTRQLIAECDCETGCPSCVHSPKCGNGNKPLDKGAAVFLLEVLTGRSEVGIEAPAEGFRPASPSGADVEGPSISVTPESAEASDDTGLRASEGVVADHRPAPTGERVVAFDLETRRSAAEVGGWGRIRDMGLALAVVEDLATGEARAYREDQVERLIIDLLSADRVVGFNVKRFDYQVLEAYAGIGTFRRVPTLDLLEEIHGFLGFRVKLAAVSQATLGASKSADGLQSLEWVREGRLDLVEEYCRQDVKVTADLYRFGSRHGYLLYPDKEERYLRVPVSW